MKNQKIQTGLFYIALLACFALFALLLWPYLTIILTAGALAVVFKPLHNQILKLTKNKKIIASLISIVLIILIVLIPLFLIGFQVFKEASSLYTGLSNNNFQWLDNSINFIEKTAQKFSPGFSLNLNSQQILSPILNFTVKHLGGLFSGAAKALLSLSLGLISLFYFLKEGREIKKYLVSLSPLSSKDNEEIFLSLKKTINASIKGGLLLAILQGLMIGIGFLIFGIPNAALWSAITVIASFIPGIGMALIIVPAAIYLLITSKVILVLGFLIWSLGSNLILDNIVSPKLKKGSGLHPLLILFSVLGGISLFGPMGIIIGPMIASSFTVMLKIYPKITNKK